MDHKLSSQQSPVIKRSPSPHQDKHAALINRWEVLASQTRPRGKLSLGALTACSGSHQVEATGVWDLNALLSWRSATRATKLPSRET